ncbi:MAG: hypothetical protein M0P61_09955 [Ignavibacteriaceae bacterium]|nr:hypothetical protein [Ignavibacteriaceae bacterium]
MDNLINILVAAIIIYSFLAPLLKKKKIGDSDQSSSPGSNPNRPATKQKPSYQNMDLDIFTEIEQMMNRGKTPPVKTIPQKEEVVQKYSDENQATASEHRLEDWDKDLKSAHQKFKISENERLNIERDLEKKFSAQRKVYYNPIFAKVKSSFLNKAEFRNGFIISEILGKPKALRR